MGARSRGREEALADCAEEIGARDDSDQVTAVGDREDEHAVVHEGLGDLGV